MNSEASKFEQFELSLTSDSKEYLYSAGKWAFFLGIIGFIFSAFMFIVAIIIGATFSNFSGNEFSNSPFNGLLGSGFIAGIYVVLSLVYGVFSYFLFQFGLKMKNSNRDNSTSTLTTGLLSLKRFFKIWGIMTIIGISLYVLLIFLAAIGTNIL